MHLIAKDFEDTLTRLVKESQVSLDRLVVIEEHPDYPGELIFQPPAGESTSFYSRYRNWMSHYLVLNEVFNLPALIDQLRADGYQLVFGPSFMPVMEALKRWSEPLNIEGYDLYGFQQFSLNRAFEQGFWFFNWAVGAGKSLVSAAGAKHLFATDQIDVVIACTSPGSKINQCRFFEAAGLRAVVNDGDKKKRQKVYNQAAPLAQPFFKVQVPDAQGGIQVFVANYEKLWHDYDDWEKICKGHRVLFVLDEATRIVAPNNARKAFSRLLKVVHKDSKIWPMTASVVDGDPLRFRELFGLDGHPRKNPLGTKEDFVSRYASEVIMREKETPNGFKVPLIYYRWDVPKLEEIRHRVGHLTQTVRKTDPGVAHLFKDMQTIPEMIQPTSTERIISDSIIDAAWEQYQERGDAFNLNQTYTLLRQVACTPLALRWANSRLGIQMAANWASTLDKLEKEGWAKLDRLNEQLTAIREAGDKTLVFVTWTNLGLHLIKRHIEVPFVEHHGDQSAKANQEAQDTFKADLDITCFLTSDIGKEGLNMQESRYVIQLNPLYSYDNGMQRAGRIHRSDSYLDGLTNFVYITEDSVEERVWNTSHERRVISEAVQGTTEALNHGHTDYERAQRSEAENMGFLIFGDRF